MWTGSSVQRGSTYRGCVSVVGRLFVQGEGAQGESGHVCASAEQAAVCMSLQRMSRLYVGAVEACPWGTGDPLEMPLLVRLCSPSWI